jgi:predicted short-subunit dehydrogenase-like oxidoreductase (DUF2520 family)
MTITTSHFRLVAIVCGLLVSAGASYRVWQLSAQPVGDTWTPAIYAPGLEATADKLEVIVSGVPLAKAVAEQQLSMATNGNLVPVKSSDVKVRLNNEPAIRAASISAMLGYAALAGGAFVLLVIGLLTPMIGAFRQHGLIDLHLPA